MASAVEVSASSDAAAAPPYARRWWALGVLSLCLVLIGLDNTILNVALPSIVRELGATASELQWIVDSYVLVFAGLLLTAGSLGDRYGRKGALQAGIVMFVIGALACIVAQSPTQLIAARAFMGIGGALIMPSTLSILTMIFPPEERPRAIGVWTAVAGLSMPIGPVVGGWLLGHFAWNSVFWINLPPAVIALVAAQRLIPNSRDHDAPRIDIPGALLSIVGLGVLLYAIIRAPEHGWTTGSTLAWFAAGVALLVAFVGWEIHTADPMLDMRFFRNPRFSAANGAITLVFFALMGSMFSMTQYLQFVLGYSALESGLRMLPIAGGMVIGAPISARLAQRIGGKIVTAGGLSIVAVGLLLLSRLQVDSGYVPLLIALLVMSIGMGCSMAPATEAVMGAIPRRKAGVGSAMNDTTRQLGGALGVAILGSLMHSIYRNGVTDSLAGVPAVAAAAARDSLGAALQVAAQSGPAGTGLALTARQAFVDAMQRGLQVGALVTVAGVVIVLLFLPAHGIDAGHDFEER